MMTQSTEFAPVPAKDVGVQMLALDQLRESPTNTRKTWGDMKELEESVRKVGVIQPLLARPIDDGWELVFGHRRFRAAKSVGLATVPVMTRIMTDLEALEFQVIENVARHDVHPLEEAESYEMLHERHHLGVEEIAAKVAKSRSQVYARMKLLALCPPARKAFYEGKLTASTALYVARIPDPKLQVEALKEIGPRTKDDEPATARDAFRIIADKYMLRLVDAPFDRASAELVPKAGACTTCPKRTGNQSELFADVKSADVCTDPICYRGKLDAHWKLRVASADADGVKVMSPTASKKAFYATGQLVYDAGFVDLDSRLYGHGGDTTYRKLLKGTTAEVTIARDEDGRIHELVPKSAVEAAQRKLRKDNPSPTSSFEKKQREKSKRAREKAAADGRVRELAIAEAARRVEAGKCANASYGAEYLRLVVGMLIEGESIFLRDTLKNLAARHKIELGTKEADETLRAMLPRTAEPVLRAMLVELALAGLSNDSKIFDATMVKLGVNVAKLHKGAKATK